jgi:hypothetical protein
MNYYITRSGKLKQQYVLWLDVSIEAGRYSCNTITGMGNVGATETVAIASAENRLNLVINTPTERSGTLKTLELCGTRKRDLVKFTAFGAAFNATPKGYMAAASSKFWDAWRADKIAVKAEGFRCFKMGGEFMMFIGKEFIEA